MSWLMHSKTFSNSTLEAIDIKPVFVHYVTKPEMERMLVKASLNLNSCEPKGLRWKIVSHTNLVEGIIYPATFT